MNDIRWNGDSSKSISLDGWVIVENNKNSYLLIISVVFKAMLLYSNRFYCGK